MKPIIEKAFIVGGLPHPYLKPELNPGWQSLHDSYAQVRKEIEESKADLILYFSSQWLSVIGYLFQADPKPVWTHVDHNWYELGSLPYEFKVDTDFAPFYQKEVGSLGHNAALVNYKGFPIDTGTIVAQKFINPDNRLPAAMVSCNMYAEKHETLAIGEAASRALAAAGKTAVAVCVTNLSQRFFTEEVPFSEDRIHSQKDDEWNQKICELLGEGRVEDVSQVAREFAKEAHADLGFKGIWWLNGLLGKTNNFRGKVYDYQPVYGSGSALVGLWPTKPVPVTGVKKPSAPAKAAPTSDTIDSETAPEPVGAYPHARRVGSMLYLSGVGPRKKGTKEIPGVTFDGKGGVASHDVAIQTQSVIDNVRTILESAGSSLDKVIDIQVFLTDMKRDFAAFNEVYAKTFAGIQATRTTVEVGSLPTPIAVEFKVVAEA